MANWITASDPRLAQPGYYDNDAGGAYVPGPYEWTKDALGLESWAKFARQLGFQGNIEGQGAQVGFDYEAGMPIYGPGYSEEFANFVAQKKREGYDFVVDADTLDKRTTTLGLRTPSGDVVGQWGAKAAGFGEFFKKFVLPAVAAYGAVNFLGPRLEGLTNALSGGGQITAADLASIPTNAMGQVSQPSALGAEGAGAGAGAGAGGAGAGKDFLSGMSDVSGVEGSGVSGTGVLTKGTNIPSEVLGVSSDLDKILTFLKSPAGASALSGLGSLLGGVIQAGAAEGASEQQAEAARNALALSREMFEYQKGLLEPYRTAGTAALERLSGAMGLGGQAQQQKMLEMDPGYGFRLGEGLKALERMQAARGNMLSGGALKAGQRYAQDYASGEYGNAYNRLANIAGLGQTAGTQLGGAAQQFGQTAGNIMGQEANALAAGRIGRGSAYGNAIQGGLNAYSNYLNQQQQNQLFRDIFGRTAIGD